MVLITIALLIIAAMTFVSYPVFQRADALDLTYVDSTDSIWENLTTQRDATYAAIKDLENDHMMGKWCITQRSLLSVMWSTGIDW